MQLTNQQKDFLDVVCFGREKWTLNENYEIDVDGDVIILDKVWYCIKETKEIPVKFGRVSGYFSCYSNQLTTLKNCPTYVGDKFYCYNNNLTNYFKNIKEEDFPHWKNLHWGEILEEYPFLINIGKVYMNRNRLEGYLNLIPQTKLYLK